MPRLRLPLARGAHTAAGIGNSQALSFCNGRAISAIKPNCFYQIGFGAEFASFRNTMARMLLITLGVLACCVQAEAEIRSINQTIKALRSIEIQQPDETIVPAAARPLLTELKHQLRDCITEILNRDPAYTDHLRNADTLQAFLIHELEHRGVRLDDTADDQDDQHLFGWILDATLERPEGHDRILAATTTLSIPYGADSSLYIYKEEGSRWALILAMEENNYTSIRTAQHGLSYVISKPDENGDFFVAIVHTTAWPVSNWQGLDYKFVRPASDPDSPTLIQTGSESVFLGVDTPYQLEASTDSVTILFQTNCIDTDILVRPRIMKFKVKGNHAMRISPVALDAQGFLEEWMIEPWNEVRKWRHASDVSDAEAWHALLHSSQEKYSVSFLFVQPCPDEKSWQIGMSFDLMVDEKAPSQQPPDTVYFTVKSFGRDYFVSSIDLKRPSGCPGKQSPRMDYDNESLSEIDQAANPQ